MQIPEALRIWVVGMASKDSCRQIQPLTQASTSTVEGEKQLVQVVSDLHVVV